MARRRRRNPSWSGVGYVTLAIGISVVSSIIAGLLLDEIRRVRAPQLPREASQS